ncbi:MAG TPA: hypothetical protein VM779_00640 [Thermoanaerobaculia bacterium]|nr:hypothetical protein [Thermoanaerobaculia bacterium]
MAPIRPELCSASDIPQEGVLAVVSFGGEAAGGDPLSLSVPIPQIGGSLVEVWRVEGAVIRESRHEVEIARTEEVLFGAFRAGGPSEEAARKGYDSIVTACREAGYPNLWRMWNHVGGINEDEGGLERYKRFSAGRHDALTRHGYAREQFPAASAVGMSEPGLLIYFIAGRRAGVQTENPRQVSAYDYPPQYGPRSPSFSRATAVPARLIFISGTASVVGHASWHAGSLVEQLEETIQNLEVTLRTAAEGVGREASLGDLAVAKIYIRGGVDHAPIEPRLRTAFPSALLLQADVCRRELLLEIEGVAVLSE